MEFRIPWAALDIRPQADYQFKIDLCLNDFDTLASFANLPDWSQSPQVNWQNIAGSSDYGFPKDWQTATLHDEPSVWHRLKMLAHWPLITLILLMLLSPLVIWLVMRNRQLRQLPRQAEDDPRLTPSVESEPVPVVVLQHEQLFIKAKEAVLQRLGEDLPPAALAAHLLINLRQLQRIFKEELQITPNAFIISIKMEEAARRLLAGETSVADLAYKLGFTDPAYFARVFRKHFGCTPTAFVERQNE